jgi:hypothetical protein
MSLNPRSFVAPLVAKVIETSKTPKRPPEGRRCAHVLAALEAAKGRWLTIDELAARSFPDKGGAVPEHGRVIMHTAIRDLKDLGWHIERATVREGHYRLVVAR